MRRLGLLPVAGLFVSLAFGFSACGSSDDTGKVALDKSITSDGLPITESGLGSQTITLQLPPASTFARGSKTYSITFLFGESKKSKGGWSFIVPGFCGFGAPGGTQGDVADYAAGSIQAKMTSVKAEVKVAKGAPWALSVDPGNLTTQMMGLGMQMGHA